MFSAQNSQVSNNINYIEDVFSTYLYAGNGSTQTITNGIDLSGKGGLIWTKSRNLTNNNNLVNTIAGVGKSLASNNTAAQQTQADQVTAFNSNGYTLGADAVQWEVNRTGYTYASWTFREQTKFFDVVTYTGNGLSSNVISHNLGSVPGFIICKRTDNTSGWAIWHRGNGTTSYGLFALNSTAAASANFSAAPTSTTFDAYNIWDTGNPANASGATYVAYLFAHNAGGFGLTGTDNVISCGSFTTDGTGAAGNITLGYEAQWLLIKRSDGVGSWNIIDVMRGSSLTSYNYLQPNASTQESSSTSLGQGIFPTATGFFVGTNFPAASANYIYVAIRRPMKVPTLGSSVFSVDTTTAANDVVSTLTFPDMGLFRDRTTATNWFVSDRLRGFTNGYYTPTIYTNLTNAEATPTTGDTVTANGYNNLIYAGGAGVAGNYPLLYSFKRAPGFFDEVCYTGTGSTTAYSHSLGVAPELMIVKSRNDVNDWAVYSSALGNTKYLFLNTTAASATTYPLWASTTPSATTFTTNGTYNLVGGGTITYVAYLFATCAGVSKVGSYTGNGTTQTIDCGFAAGARFVLIKRTDSTGDWYVYDTARGMTTLTDPYLLLNSTAAESATLGSVTTVATGFALNSTILAAINVNAGTYIFLAIA